MNTFPELLKNFILQANSGELKTSLYPKEWADLRLRISFGMGVPARIPWIAFVTPEMEVSEGFYPVYLYYKALNTLVLAYGVSETREFSKTWPGEIMNSSETISSFFNQEVPRYGDSFVFKSYKLETENLNVKFFKSNSNEIVSYKELELDLQIIINYYKKIVTTTPAATTSWSQGVFYMEKQLEDFIIHNWENTELGKKYELIIKDGELISQQYRTDIGAIDILAKDKHSKNFVVIELKRNQTSDDTVGQLARYMGWISEKMNDENVKGIIIANGYDKKLEYALKVVNNVEVFLYEVDFKLKEFKGHRK